MEHAINSSFQVCVGCGRNEADFEFEKDLRPGGWFAVDVGQRAGVCNDCASIWGEVKLLPHIADELAIERAEQRKLAAEMAKAIFRSYESPKNDAVCEGYVEGYSYLPLPEDEDRQIVGLYIHAWRYLNSRGMLERHPAKSALWRIKGHPESDGENTVSIYSDEALNEYFPPFDPVLFRDLCSIADNIPAGALTLKPNRPDGSASIPLDVVLAAIRTRNGTLHQIYDAVIERCYNDPNIAANFLFRYMALRHLISRQELPIDLVGAEKVSEMDSLREPVYEVAARISIQRGDGFDAQEFCRLLQSEEDAVSER